MFVTLTSTNKTIPVQQFYAMHPEVAFPKPLTNEVLVDYGAVIFVPEPIAPPVPGTRVTQLAFRNRFTTMEKVALEMASLDNPAATMPERYQAAGLRATLADTAAATFIDLQRPETRAGVLALEAGGLLAAGRALEILDAEVMPSEVPQ